jgi:hypothetical protein
MGWAASIIHQKWRQNMLKSQWIVAAALTLMVMQTACYTTRIVTGRAPEGPSHTERQWFTLGGLARISQPAGQHCQNGISSAESKLSGADWLIDLGLSVAGGIAGSLACSNSEPALRSSCGAAGATLFPILLSSRTVEYKCAAGAPSTQAPAYMPQVMAPVAPAPALKAPTASSSQ